MGGPLNKRAAVLVVDIEHLLTHLLHVHVAADTEAMVRWQPGGGGHRQPSDSWHPMCWVSWGMSGAASAGHAGLARNVSGPSAGPVGRSKGGQGSGHPGLPALGRRALGLLSLCPPVSTPSWRPQGVPPAQTPHQAPFTPIWIVIQVWGGSEGSFSPLFLGSLLLPSLWDPHYYAPLCLCQNSESHSALSPLCTFDLLPEPCIFYV